MYKILGHGDNATFRRMQFFQNCCPDWKGQIGDGFYVLTDSGVETPLFVGTWNCPHAPLKGSSLRRWHQLLLCEDLPAVQAGYYGKTPSKK